MSFSCKTESGVQLLARLKCGPKESIYPEIFDNSLSPGDVIELTYDINTQHATFINEILSRILLDRNFAGEEAGIILILTDGQFDIIQLVNIMSFKIKQKLAENIEEDDWESNIEQVVTKCLKKLHILYVYTHSELLLAITFLENIISNYYLNISLVMLDTAVSFYWSEQFINSNIIKMDDYLENIVTLMRNVTKTLKTTMIYTKPLYFVSGNASDILDNDPQEAKDDLKIQNFIDCQIQLSTTSPNDEFGINVIEVKIRQKSSITTKYFTTSSNGLRWLKI